MLVEEDSNNFLWPKDHCFRQTLRKTRCSGWSIRAIRVLYWLFNSLLKIITKNIIRMWQLVLIFLLFVALWVLIGILNQTRGMWPGVGKHTLPAQSGAHELTHSWRSDTLFDGFVETWSDGFAQKIERLNLCSIYAGVRNHVRYLIRAVRSFINPNDSQNKEESFLQKL